MYSWSDGSMPADMVLVPVATSSGGLIGGSEKRYALILASCNGGRYTVAPLPTVALDQGITIFSGTLPLVITYEQWGEVVRRPWSAIGSVALTVGVIEVLYG